jgi:hypothetical protein
MSGSGNTKEKKRYNSQFLRKYKRLKTDKGYDRVQRACVYLIWLSGILLILGMIFTSLFVVGYGNYQDVC